MNTAASQPLRLSEFQPHHVVAWVIAFLVHLAAGLWIWGHRLDLSLRLATPHPVTVRLMEQREPPPPVPPEPQPPAHSAAPPVAVPHPTHPLIAHPPVLTASPLAPPSAVPTATPVAPDAPSLTPVLSASLAPDAPPTELAYTGPPRIKYPVAALRAHQSGTVTLTVHVSAEGVPQSVRVKRSSGVRAIDDAAIAGVATWRFKPATRAGQSVEGDAEVSVAFKPDA